MSRITYQDDKLHQSLTTHQRAHSEAFSPQHLASASCKGCTQELGEEGDSADADDVRPHNARVQETDVGVQSRESEVKREEECPNQILNLLSYFDSKTALVGADESCHERSENRVNANDTSEEGRAQGDEQGQTDDTLTGAILECAGSTQDVDEDWPDGVHEEQHVSSASEENP